MRRFAAFRRIPVSVVLTCAALAPAVTWGTTILRVEDLGALVDEARRAVLADVIDVRYGPDEREMPSTWVTLRVDDPVFGRLPARGEKLEIKIYGAPVSMPDGSRLFVDGTPRYRPGDRYFLLLLDDSAWGFTDTAGLYQGAFRIARGTDGRETAESLGGNQSVLGDRGLGRWLGPSEVAAMDLPYLDQARAPVPYSLLRRAIERLDRGRSPDPEAGDRKPN